MKRCGRPDFAELLAEAEGCGAVREAEKKSVPAPEPIRTGDGVSLSVQGKKAIPPVRERKGKERTEEERESLNTDWQGNKVRLSASALELALDAAEKVAWETRLEKRKASG